MNWKFTPITDAQKRALRVLYYFNTPQTTGTIPEDVRKSDVWLSLTNNVGRAWWQTREALWAEIKPLFEGVEGEKTAQKGREGGASAARVRRNQPRDDAQSRAVQGSYGKVPEARGRVSAVDGGTGRKRVRVDVVPPRRKAR